MKLGFDNYIGLDMLNTEITLDKNMRTLQVTVMNKAAVNICVQFLIWTSAFFILDKCLIVKWLDHNTSVYLTF